MERGQGVHRSGLMSGVQMSEVVSCELGDQKSFSKPLCPTLSTMETLDRGGLMPGFD